MNKSLSFEQILRGHESIKQGKTEERKHNWLGLPIEKPKITG